MDALSQIIYRSDALIAENSLGALNPLRTCIDRDGAEAIAGCLHHESWRFVRCVEGPQRALQGLFRRLRADQGHANIRIKGQRLPAARPNRGAPTTQIETAYRGAGIPAAPILRGEK